MFKKGRKKWIPITVGASFVLLLSILLYFNPLFLQTSLKSLQNFSYDLLVRTNYKPVRKSLPIVIVDIDDTSIEKVGRWPWNRKILSQLISQLYQLGAQTVATDIIFSEKEENLAAEVLRKIPNPTNLQDLEKQFNYDALFAQSLTQGNAVLGFAFTEKGNPIGELPPPLFQLSNAPNISIPVAKSYLANLPEFQSAAKWGGFINASPDFDGVIRYSPMIFRYQNEVFPSLSLAAVKLFLSNPEIQIVLQDYGEEKIIEGIKFGSLLIPTDIWGRILIPFRGPPYSIPYVSAIDVLNQKVPKDKIEKKLIFIGSSATAVGDLFPTSIAPVFAGVEIHAQIASGILDGYLPYKPAWEKGVRVAITLGIGLILAIFLPYLGPIFSSLITAGIIIGLIFIDQFIWKEYGVVLMIVFPSFSFFLLYIFNEVWGYFFEGKRKRELRSVFGQYVPPECIDTMLTKKGDFGLEGEAKELTVLFSDIRQFTNLSEGLSASDLKQLLNRFLTPMTEAIFESKGTIDKYVGDMIMAFWGAPLQDPDHATHAVACAFEMQKKLVSLNQQLKNPIHIGVGINTGIMNVGDMGSKYRRAYTVLGDAVNLASRLESLTKLYLVKIIVGERTYELTKAQFCFRLLDRVKVKGKEKAVAIFEPICKLEEETEALKISLQTHQKGLEAYFQKRWDDASKIFESVKEKDPLYDLYLKRIVEYRKTPPPEDWDGTFTLQSK